MPEGLFVLHVSNISPTATREQVHQLFGILGEIDEFRVYPTETHPQYSSMNQRLAFIKYHDERAVEVGTHMTNTIFIDRAVVCIPSQTNFIPDEETALKTGGPAVPGQRQLPPNVFNQIQDLGDGYQMLITVDPKLAALGLPPYPALPANTDASKVEEIRRTVYVGNLVKGTPGEEVMTFFNDHIGEVMYLRMGAGNENLPCDYAYIEFTNQHSIPTVLQNNGIEFKGRHLRIQHSRVAIIKPKVKTAEMAAEEVEEAIRSNRQANPLDVAGAGSLTTNRLAVGLGNYNAGRVSSRSPPPRSSSNRRSRTRSPRRRRSRTRSRDRNRSSRRSPSPRSRGRDRSRDRDRSRRSRSRDRDREREKEAERERAARKEKERKEKERRERERSSSKRSRSGSRGRSGRADEKEREKERERQKQKEREKEKERSSSSSKRSHDKDEKARKRDESPPAKSSASRNSKTKKSSETPEKTMAKSEPLEADEHGPAVKMEANDEDDTGRPAVIGKNGGKEEEEENSLRERLLEKVMQKTASRDRDSDTERGKKSSKKSKRKRKETSSSKSRKESKRRRSRSSSSSTPSSSNSD